LGQEVQGLEEPMSPAIITMEE